MKFTSHLSQATLLKRTLKFLTEVITPNRQKLIIRCPNLMLPHNCDILGSKVWYSNATGQNCLPTWELVEVDGGHLVCINPDLVKPLVIEAISNGVIDELSNFTVVYSGAVNEQHQAKNIWLEDGNGKVCFVALEHIILGDNNCQGYVTGAETASLVNLSNAISIHQEGHKAMILHCVTHTGVSNVKYAHDLNAEYLKLLQVAVKMGIEVLAYKVTISYQEIKLTYQIPACLPLATATFNQRRVK